VAALIVGVHGRTSLRKPAAEGLVAAAVLAETVDDDDQAVRVRREPCAAKELLTAGTLEVVLDPANFSAHHCDLARRTRATRSLGPLE
jgi:hypothetical protein